MQGAAASLVWELYGHTDGDGALHIDMKLSQGNLGAHAGLMRENVNRH